MYFYFVREPAQRVDVLSGTFFSQAFTALDVFLFRARKAPLGQFYNS